ncbi:uncharacterized protein LOC128864471 [Anastrepha ludens]|uniref:uncharacterized protein LOC128864471 n=1 Tax=Anastrepha ludens TaxID=28586 RepID=UPI0023AFFAB1|nr:uncharacterized protein LOC128864471 [Anastrepha ludens]
MLSIDENGISSSEDSIAEDSSESEFEDDQNADYTTFNARYMGEITSLLDAHSHVNCENALKLNQEMQLRLQEVRKRLQVLLQAVQQRYLSNEHRLKLNLGKKQRGFGIRGAYLKGGTFFFKGNMFFKDLNCRNCPNNQDYEYRKKFEGEMFPMDFELCSRHVWSLFDKKAVVQAVKEQVIDYLADRKYRDRNNKSKNLTLEIKVHTEKLANLLSQVDEKFQIDWEQVSAHNLNYRHSPSSCKTMWQVYLHPSLKRSAWSAEENKRLLCAAQMHNYQNWESIAKEVSKRSDYQCFIQYQTTVCFMDTQRWGRWDKRDDTKLLELIDKKSVNGVIDWNAVAAYFPHKPKKSLHQRYIYYLDPKISHEPFTPEEDLILLAAVEEYGEKFALFPRTLFPNRSITQLRMRYKNTLQTRHMLKPWSVEDDKKLMEFVSEHGTSSWLRCAETLGNHNRISCRTRFLTIQKFFKKNPEATLEDIPRKKKCILKNSVITTENWVEKVAELRENPNTVLVPPSRRFKKINGMSEKFKKEQKTRTANEPPKCEVSKATERKHRKVPYVERLRAVEQKLYHFFKYAYNFRLGNDICTKPPNALLREVATTLHFVADPARQYVTDTSLSPYISRRCKFYLQQQSQLTSEAFKKPFDHTLPPSWSTAMGFRALCVQSAQIQLGGSKNDECIEDRKPSEIEKHEAVQRFRKRMRALFYQTALLSRLQPARFTKLITTEVAVTENCTERSAFDLARVKNEPHEFLAIHEPITVVAKDKQPNVEVSKKAKNTEKQSKAVRRKRKLQVPTSTIVQSESVTAANLEAEEEVTFEVTFLDEATLPENQTDALQRNLHSIEKDGESHLALQSSTAESSTSLVPESLSKTCISHSPKMVRKRKIAAIPSSGAEPGEKRAHIEASCDRTDFKFTNVKTEFEM